MRNVYVDYFKKVSVRIYSPSLPLRGYIDRYTIYQNVAENLQDLFLRALPNGRVTLFMHFYNSKIIIHRNNKLEEHQHFITGIFEPDKSHFLKPKTDFNLFKGLAITFTYKGVHDLLKTPLPETTNQLIPLDIFFGTYAKVLSDKLNEAETDGEMIEVLNHFFLHQLKKDDSKVPQPLVNISGLINHRRGRMTVEDISEYVNLSYKSLYRLFSNHIGIGPKTFLKIIRFNQACRLIRYKSLYSWGELVYHCGYYDQSHFIREFRFFMKESPCQFMETSGGHFYHNRPFSFR